MGPNFWVHKLLGLKHVLCPDKMLVHNFFVSEQMVGPKYYLEFIFWFKLQFWVTIPKHILSPKNLCPVGCEGVVVVLCRVLV